jgi:hypothetical protein
MRTLAFVVLLVLLTVCITSHYTRKIPPPDPMYHGLEAGVPIESQH